MNAFFRALAERALEFVRDTLIGRELLAEIFHAIPSWFQKPHERTKVPTTRASLRCCSEKPGLLVTCISNSTRNFQEFNPDGLVFSESTGNAVLVEYRRFQYRPSTLVKPRCSSKWSETSDGAHEFQLAIVSPFGMGLHPADSDVACTRNNPFVAVTAPDGLRDAPRATPSQENTYSVTSFQTSKDLEEEVGEPYISNRTGGYIWCRGASDDALILATTSSVPSGYAAVCRAYTASELQVVLWDLGALTTSVDAQTGDWCVSLVDYGSCSTYSTVESSLADACGIVLLKVVEGRRHDGTG